MLKKSLMTASGKEKIERELKHLITVEREEIKKKIAEARQLGDLKENAEYHAAKENQALLEGRIAHLQGVLANGQVVTPDGMSTHKIVFGATVTLHDLQKDEQVAYEIVGQEESDIKQRKISYTSPIGQALLGKEEGDHVVVKAPKGDLEYEVISFEFQK